jgi:uncharacterized protein YdhG (YjbR/CyaY superfamily)
LLWHLAIKPEVTQGEKKMENNQSPKNIDEYIAQFTPEIQTVMQTVRQAIRDVAPQASERISWQMPTFYLHGNLVHFAGNKSHLGLYPGASGVEHFLPELTEYKTSKGAIQFPYLKPIPLELIQKIVKFRVMENEAWAAEKEKKKK